MQLQNEIMAEKFLRSYRKLFTVQDMVKAMGELGIKCSVKEAAEYLATSPLVFSLQKKMYITKAGAFTDELFCIKPTAQEVQQGVVVIGDRCVPFADPEVVSSSLNFYMDGKRIPKSSGEFDSDQAIDMFLLYGEEYSPQYIAADPANKDLDLAKRDFELPSKVKLTGLDLDFIIDISGFRKGDRLLCCVTDWDQGIINMMVLPQHGDEFDQGEEGEKRLNWYAQLDDFMKESFDRLGPCGSIEDQVSNVFFEHRQELCVPHCGSVEEYINRYARKVSMESFGVETRLWHKGEKVPAVGKWNSGELVRMNQFFTGNAKAKSFVMPEYILSQHVYNMHWRRLDNLDSIFPFIFPEGYSAASDEKKRVLLQLNQINAIVAKQYNWFQDQVSGPVRKKALELYSQVAYLVYKIDLEGNGLMDFPQQELVILSQLYSHLNRILYSISEGTYTEGDYNSLDLSLDGMKWNFEEIQGTLEVAIRQNQTSQFKVMKK